MKGLADDNFKFDENGRKFFKPVEITVGKGEIARDEQFLLFPQCFRKTCTADTLKKQGKGLKSFADDKFDMSEFMGRVFVKVRDVMRKKIFYIAKHITKQTPFNRQKKKTKTSHLFSIDTYLTIRGMMTLPNYSISFSSSPQLKVTAFLLY